MSASGAGLKQSDIFVDVHGEFFDRWLRGMDPIALAKEIYGEYLEEFAEDDVTVMPDVCYALCLALWECGKSDGELLARANHFVPLDVEFWKENGETGLWRKRERVLERFLEKLSVPKEKPRKPKTGRVYRPSVCKGDVFAFDSGGYKCGAAVLEVYDWECWRALVVVARKVGHQQHLTLDEILASPIRSLCWYDKKELPTRYERVWLGNIPLDTDFNGRAGAAWSEDGGFLCSNAGSEGHMRPNYVYLERELRLFRKQHCLEDCTVGDFFAAGVPVLPESWK